MRRVLFTFGLVLYAVLAGGSISYTGCDSPKGGSGMETATRTLGQILQGMSGPSGIKLGTIVQAAQLVSTLLASTQKSSAEVTDSVSRGYQDLGTFLKEQKMTDATIVAMEKRMTDMKNKSTNFAQSLARTRQSAETLFGLLERRARDISNEQWRDRLLDDVARKRSEFSLKMDRAQNGLLKLSSTIKRYDDILGVLQVRRGIEGVNQYMTDIDNAVAQSMALNKEIQAAIADGMKLVDPKQFQ